MDHRNVAGVQLALDFGVLDLLLAQQVERAFHIRFRDAFRLAGDGQALVFRQRKFRIGLDGRGELQRLAAAKLDFFDVGVAEDVNFLFLHRLAIGIADELAFDLVLDVLLIFLEDQLDRRFAGAEAGEIRLLLKVLRRGREGFVHRLRVHFHSHQFFARGQIFNRNVHKNLSCSR